MNQRAIGIGAVTIFFMASSGVAELTVPFAPPVVLPLGGWGGDVTVADIDNDGDIDVIATTRVPDFFYVSTNDGAGNFSPVVQYPTNAVPRAIEAADFNNDGIIDIATADNGADGMSVMPGDGMGGFLPPIFFLTEFNTTDLDFGYFNGDEFLDVVVAHRRNAPNGRVRVLLNAGGVGAGWLGFLPPVRYSIGGGSRSVDTVDIDLDGAIDLVVANRDESTLSVLLGNGDGTFNPQIIYPAGINPRDAIAADLNGDGLPDVAAADFTAAEALIFINLGSDISGWLGLAPFVGYPNGGDGSHGITAGDIDADNDIDVLIANSITADVSVMLNDGNGVFTNVTIEEDGNFSTAAVAVADFDADGDLDIATSATAAAGSMSVFINKLPFAPADINFDGHVDTADLGILLSQFSTAGPEADINGDGVVDTADLGLLLADFSSLPGL